MASPAWIVTISGISIKIDRILQKLNNVIEDVKSIEAELKKHDKHLFVLETKVDMVEKKHAIT